MRIAGVGGRMTGAFVWKRWKEWSDLGAINSGERERAISSGDDDGAFALLLCERDFQFAAIEAATHGTYRCAICGQHAYRS